MKYVIHIRLKKVDNRWMLDQLVAADTVIKTRLVDYKQNLTEEIEIQLLYLINSLKSVTLLYLFKI